MNESDLYGGGDNYMTTAAAVEGDVGSTGPTTTAAENATMSSNATSSVMNGDFIFNFLLPAVFLNGVGLLGLVGNLISIFILSRPQMKGSTNCILIGLATYDSVLIVTRYG